MNEEPRPHIYLAPKGWLQRVLYGLFGLHHETRVLRGGRGRECGSMTAIVSPPSPHTLAAMDRHLREIGLEFRPPTEEEVQDARACLFVTFDRQLSISSPLGRKIERTLSRQPDWRPLMREAPGAA